MTTGTVLDRLAPDPQPRTHHPAPRSMPELSRDPTDMTCVLVTGDPAASGGAVSPALDRIWRHAGRPLRVATHAWGGGGPALAAETWTALHGLHGIEHHWAAAGQHVDVLLLVGQPPAALRAALPLARRAGIDIVHASGVREWSP